MNFLKEEMLRRGKTRPGPVVFVLVAAVVISVGYIMALAILAPQQLAEATAAATDLVCSGCVGTSDIADGAVTSAKIGSGQVGNSDIANNAVGSAKIGSGQVGNTDIATSAVTTSKISDTNGVYSVDIVDGQVGTADLANDAIKPIVQRVEESYGVNGGGLFSNAGATCPSGTILTGGGFYAPADIQVMGSFPASDTRWDVSALNRGTNAVEFSVYALCIGPSP
jgi:hypothetical protein